MARITPLHKKGCKQELSNYRPISNLCSLGKLYEKMILRKINELGDLEGCHQHGFKSKHSTSTAILDIQKALSERLDIGHDCIIYSVDLSAAFDMLRKNTLVAELKDSGLVPHTIIRAIDDFLADRKCVVEVDGVESKQFDVPMGCVQGSVLGPKLFNLYTRLIPLKLTPSALITTYADDSYVIISAPKGNQDTLTSEAEDCLSKHINYLKSLGMVVNQDKTEVMYITSRGGKAVIEHKSIKCGPNVLTPLQYMKVLGVTMDNALSWSKHISLTINKLSRMTGALKFIRRRLTQDQFLKVLTSQYYGTCYYACQAWLGTHTLKMDLRKLNAMHYKLLRITTGDWKSRTPREVLDDLGRVRPSTWAKYSSANLAIKILRDREPVRLHTHLNAMLYYERRSRNVPKFFDGSRLRVGRQAIGNRLKSVFDELNTEITFKESNNSLRLLLKKALNFPRANCSHSTSGTPTDNHGVTANHSEFGCNGPGTAI